MAKKLKAMAGASDRELVATVRKSAQEIWYAGLGVFATTRNEGGKVYKALVKEGKRVEATARKMAKSQLTQARSRLTKATAAASKQASATYSKVERDLTKRVNALQAKVQKLRGAKKKRPAARRTTRRAHA
jgi:poly(hydroxyalkanoate) granule-associated protein